MASSQDTRWNGDDPSAQEMSSLDYRYQASILRTHHDERIEVFRQVIDHSRRTIDLFRWFRSAGVALTALVGLSVGLFRVAELFISVPSPAPALVLSAIVALIGETVIMVLLGLAVVEIINHLLGDPYGKAIKKELDTKLLLRNELAEKERDDARADECIARAIALENELLEQRRQHSGRSAEAGQSGKFTLYSGGKTA